MSLIPAVGRKSAKMRLLIGGVYALLIVASATTVYPFLVMLGSSVTSEYDQDKYAVVPAYLTSPAALFGKYAGDKYGQDLDTIDGAYGADYARLDLVAPPKPEPGDSARVADWNRFFAGLPMMYKMAGFTGTRGAYSPAPLYDLYHDWLRKRFHDDIRALDAAYTEEDTNFLSVYPPFEAPTRRLYSPGTSIKDGDWQAFEATLPQSDFYPVLCDPLYQAYLHDEVYGGKIENLNAAWGTSFTSFSQISLQPRLWAPSLLLNANQYIYRDYHPAMDANAAQAADWTDYVRTRMPLRFVKVDGAADSGWRALLARRYIPYRPLPAAGALPEGDALRAYSDYLAIVNPAYLTAASVENLYRAHRVGAERDGPVLQTSGSVDRPPLAQADWTYVQAHAPALRWDFLTRNYVFALNYLLLHGRGVWNTVIYCAGAVLIAIIINPVCAYALSRFRLPYASSVLLFLLATMAFPAEVAMIPNFLLLKQLGLLNTFWALILPSAASGFSIFLLKGFFDSLPQELYEAGMIDGAGEMTMFLKVTLPLARPIFAVIALQAFAAAYGAFIFAMIVCQAQSHWTLMVWIYEFQAMQAPQYVIMAALVIAAIPTLLVFMAAQKVIMRGIILPSFK